MVEVTVQGLLGRRIGSVCRILEEENHTVDRIEGGERIRLEGQELFELYIFNAEVVEQIGEDTLDCALALAQECCTR